MNTPDASRAGPGEEPDLTRELEILKIALESGDARPGDSLHGDDPSQDRVLRALVRVVLALHASDANVTKAINELARLPKLLAQQLDVSMRSHEVLAKRIAAIESRA